MSNSIFEDVHLRQVAGRLSTEYSRSGKCVAPFKTPLEYAYFIALSGSDRFDLSEPDCLYAVLSADGDFTGKGTPIDYVDGSPPWSDHEGHIEVDGLALDQDATEWLQDVLDGNRTATVWNVTLLRLFT